MNRDKDIKREKEERMKEYFEKQREIKAHKENAKKEYLQFYESPEIQNLYDTNFETISESYLKFCKEQKYTRKRAGPDDFKMNFNAYKKFGHDMKLYPNILSFEDFQHVFKTITKEKAEKTKNMRKNEENKIEDKDTLNLTFTEFKDALMRISCLSKESLKSGGSAMGKRKSKAGKGLNKGDTKRLDSKSLAMKKSKSPAPTKGLDNKLNGDK